MNYNITLHKLLCLRIYLYHFLVCDRFRKKHKQTHSFAMVENLLNLIIEIFLLRIIARNTENFKVLKILQISNSNTSCPSMCEVWMLKILESEVWRQMKLSRERSEKWLKDKLLTTWSCNDRQLGFPRKTGRYLHM